MRNYVLPEGFYLFTCPKHSCVILTVRGKIWAQQRLIGLRAIIQVNLNAPVDD